MEKLVDQRHFRLKSLMEMLTSMINLPQKICHILPNDFVSFLESTYLVMTTDQSIENSHAMNVDDNLIVDYINKFNETTKSLSEKPYLNLFNILIGQKNWKQIKRNSIYHYDPTLNCLRLINGKCLNFYHQTESIQNKNDDDDWHNVKQPFKYLINNNNNSSDNDIENDPFWIEYQLDQKQKHRFRIYCRSSPLNRTDLFYSRQSSGRVSHSSNNEFPFIQQDSNDLLAHAYHNIFGAKAEHMANKQYRLDQYLLMIRNNINRTNFESLVRYYCPMSSSSSSILDKCVKWKHLFGLIHAIYYQIVPIVVVGGARNHRTFGKNLNELFSSSHVTNFRVWDVMHDIQMDRLRPLFKDIYNNLDIFIEQNELEMLFLCWLFRTIKYIIKQKFYVTESSSTKYALLYYRYDQWAKLNNKAINNNIRTNRWSLIIDNDDDDDESMKCENITDYFKHSSLRLIPKRNNDVRPINRLRYSKMNLNKDYRHQTSIIVGLLNCLNRNIERQQQSLSNDQFHNELLKFNSKNIDGQCCYVIRGDFQHCYQSINLKKLMSIILTTIQLMTKNMPGERIKIGNKHPLPAKLFVKHVNINKKCGHYHYRKKNKLIIINNNNDDDDKLNHQLIIEQVGHKNLCNAIIDTNDVTTVELDTKKIINLLRVYLEKTVIYLGKNSRCRFVGHGIRQGAPLSDELCQLYLNYAWRKLFNNQNDDELFFRFVDDFIFITKNVKRAQNFLKILHQIQHNYNLSVNKDKLCINFDDNGVQKVNYAISFLGRELIINGKQIVVRIDLNSFAGMSIKDCFNCNRLAPLLYRIKMLSGANIGCHCYSEMFDSRINPLSIIIDNVYRRLLLQSMKLACCLLSNGKNEEITTIYCMRNVYRFIYHTSRRFYRFIRKCNIVECNLMEIHIHWIMAEAMNMLWNTVLKHRPKIERSMMARYCEQLKTEASNSSSFNLNVDVYDFPRKMFHPFDKIKLK